MYAKFQFLLNALLYGLWRLEIIFEKSLQRAIYKSLSFLLKSVSPKRFHPNIDKRIERGQKFLSSNRYNPKSGTCIDWANTIFGLFYCSFPFFISCLIFGLIVKMLEGNVHPIIIAIVLIIPISALWYPAKKAVYDNNIYLEYFKEFEKEDERWHKKCSPRGSLA